MEYSILQTVYRSDNPVFLIHSIESMLSQTCPSNNYVIVEDGPVPDVIESVLTDLECNHPEISIIHLPTNIGLGSALNAGLLHCKNELVARMDSDDISLPDRCARQLSCFESDPDLDIVGCHVKEFNGIPENIVGQRVVPLDNDSIHNYVRRRDPFNHPSVMFRKSKVLAYGPYGDYRKNQDTDLWIKLLSNGCKGKNIDDFLLLFRFDEETYKKRKSWANTESLIRIRWHAFKSGYCSFWDLATVTLAQMGIFIMPEFLQKFTYKHILR